VGEHLEALSRISSESRGLPEAVTGDQFRRRKEVTGRFLHERVSAAEARKFFEALVVVQNTAPTTTNARGAVPRVQTHDGPGEPSKAHDCRGRSARRLRPRPSG
jgi:hypothetical protein